MSRIGGGAAPRFILAAAMILMLASMQGKSRDHRSGLRAGTGITSDQLPQFKGMTWAAEIKFSSGENLVYMLNLNGHGPAQMSLVEYMYYPNSKSKRLEENWRTNVQVTPYGTKVYGPNSEYVTTLQTDQPFLIAGGVKTRVLRMPDASEKAVQVPSVTVEDTESLGCCLSCLAVHCGLCLDEFDCICCFWKGGCGFTCGPGKCGGCGY